MQRRLILFLQRFGPNVQEVARADSNSATSFVIQFRVGLDYYVITES